LWPLLTQTELHCNSKISSHLVYTFTRNGSRHKQFTVMSLKTNRTYISHKKITKVNILILMFGKNGYFIYQIIYSYTTVLQSFMRVLSLCIPNFTIWIIMRLLANNTLQFKNRLWCSCSCTLKWGGDGKKRNHLQ